MSDTCGSYGGLADSGEPCGRPAGWGTSRTDGPCTDHSDAVEAAKSPARTGADAPKPPGHLSPEAKCIWRDVAACWHLAPDGRELLRTALESWDTYQQARAVLQDEGPTVRNPDSGNVRRHPAHSVAKDALKSFRLCLKDIGLEPLNWEKL